MEATAESKIKTLDTIRTVINVATVLFYIIFSVIKRFGNSPDLYWIPLILFFASFCILVEVAYSMATGNRVRRKGDIIWLVTQLVINLGFLVLIATYLF